MPNRLADEQSPYLLQHKDNPVDWYPWGDAAFERARAEAKPIFLSIGYSTCHWCHVMEHESFEDAGIAGVLNRHFVSIKVDREERPDVDRVYMTFVQATTGSGGWPMSVWLTPALEPFYGGTYFPPSSRWGKPGFAEVLEEIERVWREERERVIESAATILQRLRGIGAASAASGVPGPEALEKTVGDFAATFDSRRGGFGNAPKFPRPSELLFLLREHARTGESEPKDMALVTLRAMALGGMRDHLGGGFHRYSVDGDWRVPHFEKMLYDQAQLTLAYVEASQVTGDRFYADVAVDTLEYVRRDLADAGGGFHSAEDADSVPPEHAAEPSPHKMEGAFYIWRSDEVDQRLGSDAPAFKLRYGILDEGNAPFDPQQEFVHKNLLYTARPLDAVASETRQTVDTTVRALYRGRQTLFDARTLRPRPHLDDKVLTAWNGLIIAALARTARLVPVGDGAAADYAADAARAARFIRDRLWDPRTGTLLRRYRNGHAGVDGYAEDYAYLIFGLLELFQTDGNPAWLEWALALQRRQDAAFWDPVESGWFSTSGADPSVLLRMKEEYDGAEPAVTSIGAFNLLALSHLTGDAALADRLDRTLGQFGARLARSGRAAPMMMAALSTHHAGIRQVVIAGDVAAPETQALSAVVRAHYLPASIVLPLTPAFHDGVARLLPWTAGMRSIDGQATAYVCQAFACRTPTRNPKTLEDQLLGWEA